MPTDKTRFSSKSSRSKLICQNLYGFLCGFLFKLKHPPCALKHTTLTRRLPVSSTIPFTSARAAAEAGISTLLSNTAPYKLWTGEEIAALCAIGHRTTLSKGESLALTGQKMAMVYLLERGVFEVVVTLANGSDQALGYLHPGAFIGLTHAFSLIPHEETLDYVAESDVSLWRMPAEKFKTLMREHHPIAETILAILSTRLGMMVDAVANNCLLGAEARVARCLLKSQRDAEFKVLWAKSSTAQFNVTQAQLARMLGLSRQSVGTILRDFEQKGLITMGRQKIELLNSTALRELVSGPIASVNK